MHHQLRQKKTRTGKVTLHKRLPRTGGSRQNEAQKREIGEKLPERTRREVMQRRDPRRGGGSGAASPLEEELWSPEREKKETRTERAVNRVGNQERNEAYGQA